ncbi:MAG TPA: hypothetical protein VMR14_14600 [Streptosporangiaceae bacterium]|nr:hypothetical protein [Streptosporangiaceae bacterium]
MVAKACAWLAAGGILLFAVSGHPSFLNLQLVGLILIGRGVAGFYADLGRQGRARCARQFKAAIARGAAAIEFLDAFTTNLTRGEAHRVPLDELLSRRP